MISGIYKVEGALNDLYFIVDNSGNIAIDNEYPDLPMVRSDYSVKGSISFYKRNLRRNAFKFSNRTIFENKEIEYIKVADLPR